jgi:toxin ParE1/3/4
MKPALLWTPQAREDLFDIYVTIGLDNPSAAERMHTALEEQANLLATTPRMGVRRLEIAPAARMLVQGVYVILYETHPDTDEGPIRTVEIVLDCARPSRPKPHLLAPRTSSPP